MSAKIESVAAVIPVYNPEPGLPELCRKLLEFFALVVIVDDGSIENRELFPTPNPQSTTPILLSHPVNRGKGAAIKTAFEYLSRDCPRIRAAVFVDGDGQHRVEDAASVAKAALDGDRAAIGYRRFGNEVPFRSRFGNFWTSIWTWVFLGVYLRDTQTGLRAIPSRLFPEMLEFKEDGFAYEMRLWGFLKRRHEKLAQLPIETIYIESNRASHYDPWKDTCRVYRVLFSDSLRRLGF